jgi:hypothetical protein
MILLKRCDGCGVEGNEDEIATDYNGTDRCRKCAIKHELSSLESALKEKLYYVKTIQGKEIREIRLRISDLRKEMETILL